jgi:hypothetical protein
MSELTAAELSQVLATLDRIGDELGQIGTWLAKLDHDQASMLLQDAWHSGRCGTRSAQRGSRGRNRPPEAAEQTAGQRLKRARAAVACSPAVPRARCAAGQRGTTCLRNRWA